MALHGNNQQRLKSFTWLGNEKNKLPKILLMIALAALSIQLLVLRLSAGRPASEMVLDAAQGSADMTLRNEDFPETYISTIKVDLTSPNHWVQLTWTGPNSGSQESGPFHSSPGGGRDDNDCNDCEESNRGGSFCTPKGTRFVEGFSDTMDPIEGYNFVTWFHSSRRISFHSHPNLPDYPGSIGCVRLNEHAAKLIHNNSIVGKTKVIVDGTWTRKGELHHAQANLPDAARNLAR